MIYCLAVCKVIWPWKVTQKVIHTHTVNWWQIFSVNDCLLWSDFSNFVTWKYSLRRFKPDSNFINRHNFSPQITVAWTDECYPDQPVSNRDSKRWAVCIKKRGQKNSCTAHLKTRLKVSCELNQQSQEIDQSSDFVWHFTIVPWEKYEDNLPNSKRVWKSEEPKEAKLNFAQKVKKWK